LKILFKKKGNLVLIKSAVNLHPEEDTFLSKELSKRVEFIFRITGKQIQQINQETKLIKRANILMLSRSRK